jgi:hypothetical protein
VLEQVSAANSKFITEMTIQINGELNVTKTGITFVTRYLIPQNAIPYQKQIQLQ